MAVDTSAMLRTCAVRFDAIEFTLSVKSFHVPAHPGPVPASQAPFSSHFARDARHLAGEGVQLIHHGVHGLLEFENSPDTSTVILCDKSPRATAVVTCAMLRT